LIEHIFTHITTGAIIGAAGDGVFQALQSILASFVEPSATGQLYATVAFVQLISGAAGSYLFAALFSIGMKSSLHRMIGLPFAVSSVRYSKLYVQYFEVGLLYLGSLSHSTRISKPFTHSIVEISRTLEAYYANKLLITCVQSNTVLDVIGLTKLV
jgi:hypothetical protein